jgi:hypothetical protein
MRLISLVSFAVIIIILPVQGAAEDGQLKANEALRQLDSWLDEEVLSQAPDDEENQWRIVVESAERSLDRVVLNFPHSRFLGQPIEGIVADGKDLFWMFLRIARSSTNDQRAIIEKVADRIIASADFEVADMQRAKKVVEDLAGQMAYAAHFVQDAIDTGEYVIVEEHLDSDVQRLVDGLPPQFLGRNEARREFRIVVARSKVQAQKIQAVQNITALADNLFTVGLVCKQYADARIRDRDILDVKILESMDRLAIENSIPLRQVGFLMNEIYLNAIIHN